MFKAFTNRVSPQPVFLESSEPLLNQLALFSIPFPDYIISTFLRLTFTSSFLFLIQLLLYTFPTSVFLTPLTAIYYFFVQSPLDIVASYNKHLDKNFLYSIITVNSKEELSKLIEDYLDFPVFDLTLFLENPFYLLDWLCSIDKSLTSICKCIKELDPLSFYIELIRMHNDLDIRDIKFQYRALKENVQRLHFNYVIGADISDVEI